MLFLGVKFSTLGKVRAWWEDRRSLVPFLNRLAHDKGFHPAAEYANWNSISYNDLYVYQVTYSEVQVKLYVIKFSGWRPYYAGA